MPIEEPEDFPVASFIIDCDRAIAVWRSPIFYTAAIAFFNAGMVPIRLLDIWADGPGFHWISFMAFGTLWIHLASFVVCLWSLRKARRCRQKWQNLRHCFASLAKSRTRNQREFFSEQTLTALSKL